MVFSLLASSPRRSLTILRKLLSIFSLAGVLLSLGAPPTISAASDEVPFPTGFRDWFVVNSMIVTKDSPLSAQIGGLHVINVNAKGLPTLKSGGPFPYPDGAAFADDVHDFSVKDGPKSKAPRKP